MDKENIKVIILCGGKGTRAFPFTKYLPKPMMPLGGSPIIVQVIKNFIHQGFTNFVLAAGYLKVALDDYFEGKDIGATIQVVDTGEESNTGERVYACREFLGDRFIVTYADGLCDVRLDTLLQFHDEHKGCASIVSVPMRSQYGVLTIADNGKVKEFREKPVIDNHWINAGYIVFNKSVFSTWQGQDLEREVLPNLIYKGLGYSYRHTGFFKSMDGYKDAAEFEELLKSDTVPWAVKS